MLDQTFSLKNLLVFRKRIDGTKYDQKPQLAQPRLSALANSIASGTFQPIPFSRRQLNGIEIYSTNSYENAIVLRKLNNNLKRLYKARQADRTRISKQVALLLSESCPKSVIRLDIKSFYDSIDRKFLLKRIADDALLSSKSKHLLTLFLEKAFPGLHGGLPRGVNVSATLSEYAMRDFDSTLARLHGVHFYARYVDDIIIFAFNDPDMIIREVESNLPRGMELNHSKTEVHRVIRCRCADKCTCEAHCKCKDKCQCTPSQGGQNRLNFLGYQFRFDKITKANDKRQSVFITMSDRKVKKTKTRIIRAFRSYMHLRDYPLLRDRIMFLTGNHVIKASNSDQNVRAGVFYSYRLLTLDRSKTTPTAPTVITELDHFLRNALYASKSAFGQRISAALTNHQKNQLQLITFRSGFTSRRVANFQPDRIRTIKECW